MAEKTAVENGKISNFEGLVTLIGSYCIRSCITCQPLTTYQTSLKSKKVFVDGRTYIRTYAWTDERTDI